MRTTLLPDPGAAVMKALSDAAPTATDVPRYRFWGDRKPPENRAEMFSTTLSPVAAADEEGDEETSAETPVASGSVATIRIYGPIDSWGGWWGISSHDVATVLDALPADVEQIIVRLNSPGGHVWEGMAILNMLRAHKATVTAVVDGVAASAASVIASGADQTVMSPGTQMMVHDASTFAYGDAALMRKAASFLDSVSNAISSIYAEVAGGTDEDWRAVMVEETWYTAKEAVTAGLADRVAVVPDSGPSETAGTDEPDAGDGSEVEDTFDLSIYNHAGRSSAPAPKQPGASAPGSTSQRASALGDTSQEGGADVNDTQLATLRQKVGVSADADLDTVFAALDEALLERANPSAPPAGTVHIDEAALAALQADAAAGRAALDEQVSAQRVALVTAAVNDGRIPPARKEHWLAQLAADDEGARSVLAGLPKGLIPVAELGHGDGVDDASATDHYADVFGDEQKGA